MTLYELYYGKVLKVYIYNREAPASIIAADVVRRSGHEIVNVLTCSDIAIAPLLTEKLSQEKYSTPRLGTLIFHPSLLPRHRGADAIKWAYKLNESYTGVTWFWCSDGYDTGDICEQEIIPLNVNTKPRDFYESTVMSAMIKTLSRLLEDIARGNVRRVPQNEAAATYEQKIKREK